MLGHAHMRMKNDVRFADHSRLRAVLATCAYLIAALPVWYILTTVPRPNLQHKQMQNAMGDWEENSQPHVNLVIYIVQNKGRDGRR